MPISVPVPKEYAQRYDRETPSTYGEGHAVYTGPYMIESDAAGQGRRLRSRAAASTSCATPTTRRSTTSARRSWTRSTSRAATTTRRSPRGGSSPARAWRAGEIEPPANQLKRLLESNKTELSVVPGGGWRMISMDTSRPPFDDIDVRKAVIAGFNRAAARQQRGGEALGPIAQHLIPPGMAGFEESGAESRAGSTRWTGSRSRRATAPSRPSTSRRRASRRASTRAARRCCWSPTTPSRRSRSPRSPSSSSTRWASRRSCAWSRATR